MPRGCQHRSRPGHASLGYAAPQLAGGLAVPIDEQEESQWCSPGLERRCTCNWCALAGFSSLQQRKLDNLEVMCGMSRHQATAKRPGC